DRLGEFALSEAEAPLTPQQIQLLAKLLVGEATSQARLLTSPITPHASRLTPHASRITPSPLRGAYHKTLQRSARATPNPASPQVLNTFAYTCGFSVCAAKAGARTTSLDLSKKYLEWGKRNFAHNQIDPARHEFLHGDVFGWLRRLARKQRLFDAIVLDPP